MEKELAESFCVFHWEIKNPYVPPRRFRGVFVHGSRTPLYWKVELGPVLTDHNRMSFTGLLGHLYFEHNPDNNVPTDKFEIKIWANRTTKVFDRAVRGFTFARGRHPYHFDFTIPLQNCHQYDTDSDFMMVVVIMYFPRRETVNREEKQLDWLSDLSGNLKDLLVKSWGSLYSDLRLLSRDEPASPFQVHACIVSVRWDCFFDVHPGPEITDQTVETGISHAVLKEILVYVYSGQYFREVVKDERLTTELWQVVEKYKMYGIYGWFKRIDSVLVRLDSYHCIKKSHIFNVSARRGVQRFLCSMYTGTDYEVGVEFEICLGDTNTFSYLLISKSPHNLYARVILELGRFIRVNGPRPEFTFRAFHAKDYEIQSNGRVKSGNFSIDEAFGTKILLTLRLSDGTNTVAVKGDHPKTQTESDQFHLLSDHMSVWISDPDWKDLRIICPTSDPSEYRAHHLHKAIFVARVPNWKAALRDIPEEVTQDHAIPDEVRCDVRYRPFESVIYSIYTGKSCPLPRESNRSVVEFAHNGGIVLFDYDFLVILSQYTS